MNRRSDPNERSTITAGCLIALGSAMVTCLMLFLNGSLVMAVLTTFTATGPSWVRKPEFSQFLLFLLPVLLVIVEWMMIDYIRGKMRWRSSK